MKYLPSDVARCDGYGSVEDGVQYWLRGQREQVAALLAEIDREIEVLANIAAQPTARTEPRIHE